MFNVIMITNSNVHFCDAANEQMFFHLVMLYMTCQIRSLYDFLITHQLFRIILLYFVWPLNVEKNWHVFAKFYWLRITMRRLCQIKCCWKFLSVLHNLWENFYLFLTEIWYKLNKIVTSLWRNFRANISAKNN